jgi:hypothetical protein
MPTEIINSKRFFQMWSYSVGHSEMLLRSTKSADYPTRIDVFFKGVEEFQLPTTFHELSIAEVSDAEVPTLHDFRRSPQTGYDYKIFVIKGVDFVGYVVALLALCHEDNGEYYEPSFFSLSKVPGA